MAWTQADVDTLKAAIASGVKRVRYKDHEKEYQDLAEMRKALSAMIAEVNGASGTPTITRLTARKGYDSCR